MAPISFWEMKVENKQMKVLPTNKTVIFYVENMQLDVGCVIKQGSHSQIAKQIKHSDM